MIKISERDYSYENNKELLDKISKMNFNDLVEKCFGVRDEQIVTKVAEKAPRFNSQGMNRPQFVDIIYQT